MPPKLATSKKNTKNTALAPVSLDSVDVKLDSIIAEQLKLEKIILSLRTDVEELKKVNGELVASNQGLLKENLQLNKKLDELNTRTVDNNHKITVDKQTSFDCSIEIYGIEEQESEDLNEIIEKIVERIDPTFVKNNITKAYRRRTRGPNTSIVVSLGSSKNKKEFLKKRKGIVLNTLNVFSGLKAADILIYGYLIEETKRLLHSAHSLKKQGLIKDIWVRGSEIFIKTDDRDHHKVICNSDLNKLLVNQSQT